MLHTAGLELSVATDMWIIEEPKTIQSNSFS